MLENLFGNKVAKNKISSSTGKVLDLEVEIKRLEMSRDQIKLELDNQKSRNEMALEKDRHQQQLKLSTEMSKFANEREKWDAERKELQVASDKALKELKDTLEREHKITLQEAVSLTKLESQQKIKQAELDRDREVNKIRMEQAEALAKVRADSAEETYKKLSNFIEEVATKGDKNTKFVQEMALIMMKGAPQPTVGVEVGVNRPVAIELKD